MSHSKAALEQSELTRYAKAMRNAGYDDWRLEVRPDGTVSIIAGKVDENAAGPDPDELLK